MSGLPSHLFSISDDVLLHILQFLHPIEVAQVVILFKFDVKIQSISIPLSFLRSSLVDENRWFPNITVDVSDFSDHDITLIGNICTRLHMNPPFLYQSFPRSIGELVNLTTIDLGKNFDMIDTPFGYMPNIHSIIVSFSITPIGITLIRATNPTIADKFYFPTVSCSNRLTPEMVEIIRPTCKQLHLSGIDAFCRRGLIRHKQRIDRIPDNFHLLGENLETLDLGNCWLDRIPDEIFNLRNLRCLELGRWYNHAIDWRWLRLTNLEQFLIGSYYQHALPIDLLIQMPCLKAIRMNSKYLYKHRDHMLALQCKIPHISFQDFKGNQLDVHTMFPIDTILPWFYWEKENGMDEYPMELDMNLNYIYELIPELPPTIGHWQQNHRETIIPHTILHPDEMEALERIVVRKETLDPSHDQHLIAALERIGWYGFYPSM